MKYKNNAKSLTLMIPKINTNSRRNLNNTNSVISSSCQTQEPIFSYITTFQNELIKKSINENQSILDEKSPINLNIKSFLSTKITLKKNNVCNRSDKIPFRKINIFNINKTKMINKYKQPSISILNDSSSEIRSLSNSKLKTKIDNNFNNSFKRNSTIIKLKSKNIIDILKEKEKKKNKILFNNYKNFNVTKKINSRNPKGIFLIDCYNNKNNSSLYSKISYPYIKSAHVLVNTSSYEACPRVVAEAKILKTPVICADFSFSYEFVDNGVDGFIDSLQNLPAIIGSLINDENLYNKIKQKCLCYEMNVADIMTKLDKVF